MNALINDELMDALVSVGNRRRFRMRFDRIVTPRFTKDVGDLQVMRMDIRQILADNAIKDLA